MRPLPPIPDWVTLEHQVAQILQTQEENGWTFDERAAWELTSALQKEYEETVKILRERHPQVQGSEFTPKRDNRTQGYVRGATFTRTFIVISRGCFSLRIIDCNTVDLGSIIE